MLSRKYYKQFAEILKSNDVIKIRKDFIELLKNDNPNFDIDRFKSAME